MYSIKDRVLNCEVEVEAENRYIALQLIFGSHFKEVTANISVKTISCTHFILYIGLEQCSSFPISLGPLVSSISPILFGSSIFANHFKGSGYTFLAKTTSSTGNSSYILQKEAVGCTRTVITLNAVSIIFESRSKGNDYIPLRIPLRWYSPQRLKDSTFLTQTNRSPRLGTNRLLLLQNFCRSFQRKRLHSNWNTTTPRIRVEAHKPLILKFHRALHIAP